MKIFGKTNERRKESRGLMKVRVLHDLVVSYGLFLFFLSLFIRPLTTEAVLCSLMILPYVVLAEVLLRKVRNFFVFSGGLLLGLFGVYLVQGSLAGKILAVILCCLILAFSYYSRIAEIYLFYPTLPWLLLGLALYGVALTAGNETAGKIAFLYEAVTALLVLAGSSEKSCEHALWSIPEGGSLPMGQIRGAYRAHYLKWTVLGGVLFFLLYLIHFGETFFTFARNLLKGFATGIFGALFYVLTLFGSDQGAGEAESGEKVSFATQSVGEASPWMRQMVKAAAILLLVIFFIFLFRVLRNTFKSFFVSFRGATIRGTDKAEFYEPEEKREKVRKKRERRPRGSHLSPAGGIRRCYVKLIRSGNGKELRESYTPREIEARALVVSAESANAADRIHRLYEKARYCPEECTGEDLAEMKSCVKNLR